MTTERERRLAENETLFRAANERMAGWEEQHAEGEDELYMCECAHASCRERIALSRGEYEHVRERSDHFVVLPGHEVLDVETVVERSDRWLIVEKNPGVSDIVERSDPRRDGR